MERAKTERENGILNEYILLSGMLVWKAAVKMFSPNSKCLHQGVLFKMLKNVARESESLKHDYFAPPFSSSKIASM
jgi:hypothetical protein